jgi:phosphoribosyl-AMP cyclohydrolase / phosphoribosyl-ATP pyrophosphohydrolase
MSPQSSPSLRIPDFTQGLVPAVIQDLSTQRILMLGYMNQEAFEQTVATGRITFFSRSKKRLWVKGETSHYFLNYHNHQVDCDNDAILFQVTPEGPTCHTGGVSCFDEETQTPVQTPYGALLDLEKTICNRIADASNTAASGSSYIATLVAKGPKAVSQKVGEEGVEVALEGMRNNDKELLNESADLLFHLMILLCSRGKRFADVIAILEERKR